MPKKIPNRMCVSCRQMFPKKELIRVVKNSEGEICYDETGKQSARGAYICTNKECFEKAIKTRILERTLDGKLSEESINRIKEVMSVEVE